MTSKKEIVEYFNKKKLDNFSEDNSPVHNIGLAKNWLTD